MEVHEQPQVRVAQTFLAVLTYVVCATFNVVYGSNKSPLQPGIIVQIIDKIPIGWTCTGP